MQYLTLENIVVSDVSACLDCIGRQLKGLKVQCADVDLTEVALFCPELQYLVIQKDVSRTCNTMLIELLNDAMQILPP